MFAPSSVAPAWKYLALITASSFVSIEITQPADLGEHREEKGRSGEKGFY